MKFTKVTLLILIILLSVISCKKTENQTTENSESVINRIDGRVKDINGRIPERKEIDKDYYFIFYGAEWCPFCKKRQPIISTFYNEYIQRTGDFEIILAGAQRDKSNEDLIKYMEKENFPFYYVDYDFRKEAGFFNIPEVTECEKFYIPAMILMDKNGKVLSCSNGPSKSDYNFMRPIEEYLRMQK
nr:thioredoxin-like domain-containing protein [uncultured Treponema sp.]